MFADSTVAEVDMADKLAGLVGPIFERLRDPAIFAEVSVDIELGTILWLIGADLAPQALDEAAVSTRCRISSSRNYPCSDA